MNSETVAALQRIAAAFGEIVATIKRVFDAACRSFRCFAVTLSVAVISGWHPQADRPRLTRHLQACRDPFGRTQYLLAQARRGHRSPLLA